MAGKRRASRSARRRTTVLIVVGVLVLAVVGVGGYLFVTADRGDQAGSESSATVTTQVSAPPVADPELPQPKLALGPLKNSGTKPTPQGVAKALQPILSDPAMAQYAGEVLDPASGTVLWSKDASSPQLPASLTKLLTGAALLKSVDDPNKRLTTTVVKGEQPGDIVFVGGGDVTLSAATQGVTSVYEGAPTVAQLAEQVKASGVKVKRILLDTSYWTGPELAEGWKTEDIRGTAEFHQGFITRMQALMVDGDREDPSNEDSIRTGEPAQTAGKALARALGNADLPIQPGAAPQDAQVIASVHSQPLSILLAQALLHSDNVLAESLAREVAGAMGAPRSFEGATAAIMLALQDMGIDTINVDLYDGSGMSEKNTVTADALVQVLARAVNGKNPTMRYLLPGLPVAYVSGTLTSQEPYFRFTDPSAKDGRGWVRAKTGSLNVTYGMAGYVPDSDGRMLVFSIISTGVVSTTRQTLDAFATKLRQCGCTG